MRLSIGERLQSVPVKWIAVAGAVVILAISTAFGGLAQAQVPGVPQVAAGHAIDGLPWNVTVVSAAVAPSTPARQTVKAGDRWFIVIATVEVTAKDDGDGMDLTDALRVRGVSGLDGAAADQSLMVQDGQGASAVSTLSPGMPERLAFLWEQPSTAPVPSSADVAVYDEVKQPDLNGYLAWFADATAQAVVRVPVTAVDGHRPASGPRQVAAGTAIDGQPWTITVTTAIAAPSQTGLETSKAGDRWFIVLATVTVAQSIDDLSAALRVTNVADLRGAAAARFVSVQTSFDVTTLAPGAAQQVLFLWEQPTSAPRPTSVDVAVYDETQGPDLNGILGWIPDSAAQAVVRLPVKDELT